MQQYQDHFPTDIPLPSQQPGSKYHHIQLIDADQKIKTRTYSCPQKFRVAWRMSGLWVVH